MVWSSENSGRKHFVLKGHDNPLQYSCLENSLDRRAWWASSPWDHKESDTTERLTLSLSFTHATDIY